VNRDDALAALSAQTSPSPAPKPRKRRRRWPLVAGFALLVALVLASYFASSAPGLAVTVAVATSPPREASGARRVLSASGYVIARRETTVSSRITGMIRKVYVQEGMHVHRGQILALLYDHTTHNKYLAALRQYRADRAGVAALRATLRYDRLNYERTRAIYRRGLTSRNAYDQARALYRNERALVGQAEANTLAARAQVRLAALALAHTRIRAPFSGVVTAKYAHRGEMISPEAVGGFTQTGICKVVDMRSLEVDVDVNEAYIRRVRAGQPAQIVLDAYPDHVFPAHVISIVPTANRAKGTVKVRVAFQKLSPIVLPDMSANVYFLAGSGPAKGAAATTGVLVPEAAVRGYAHAHYVYRVRRHRLVRVAVRLGARLDHHRLVLAGLAPGDVVVLHAAGPLKPGLRVRIVRKIRRPPAA
jgi:RND family efflux transporter MFP subunit